MRTVLHSVHNQQTRAIEAVSNPDDVAFFEAQLLRTVSLALSAVGFDSVKPTALEAFRAEIEQYMLRFLANASSSMNSNRRIEPIPQDFIWALAQTGIMPSDLLPHLELAQAPSVTQPPLLPAPLDEAQPPPLDAVLGPGLTGSAIQRKYVPAHLPPIPSKHTWQHTPIYTKRENDARRIRELATQEGVLAEQAMRKLMASGVHTKSAIHDRRSPKDQKIWDDAMKSILEIDEKQRALEEHSTAHEWDTDGSRGAVEGSALQSQADYDSGMLVNYDKMFWRKTPQKRKR